MDLHDSYDSNHAVIFRDIINHLSDALKDIVVFYREKGLTPIIYQSTLDNGYFTEIKDDLSREGFNSWIEEQKFMVLMTDNVTENANQQKSVTLTGLFLCNTRKHRRGFRHIYFS